MSPELCPPSFTPFPPHPQTLHLRLSPAAPLGPTPLTPSAVLDTNQALLIPLPDCRPPCGPAHPIRLRPGSPPRLIQSPGPTTVPSASRPGPTVRGPRPLRSTYRLPQPAHIRYANWFASWPMLSLTARQHTTDPFCSATMLPRPASPPPGATVPTPPGARHPRHPRFWITGPGSTTDHVLHGPLPLNAAASIPLTLRARPWPHPATDRPTAASHCLNVMGAPSLLALSRRGPTGSDWHSSGRATPAKCRRLCGPWSSVGPQLEIPAAHPPDTTCASEYLAPSVPDHFAGPCLSLVRRPFRRCPLPSEGAPAGLTTPPICLGVDSLRSGLVALLVFWPAALGPYTDSPASRRLRGPNLTLGAARHICRVDRPGHIPLCAAGPRFSWRLDPMSQPPAARSHTAPRLLFCSGPTLPGPPDPFALARPGSTDLLEARPHCPSPLGGMRPIRTPACACRSSPDAAPQRRQAFLDTVLRRASRPGGPAPAPGTESPSACGAPEPSPRT